MFEGAGEGPAADLEDLPTEEPAAEPAESDLADLADLATEPSGPAHAEEEEEEEKEPSKLPIAIELVAIFGLPVVIIALAMMQFVDPWVGLYVFLMACIPYALWKGLCHEHGLHRVSRLHPGGRADGHLLPLQGVPAVRL